MHVLTTTKQQFSFCISLPFSSMRSTDRAHCEAVSSSSPAIGIRDGEQMRTACIAMQAMKPSRRLANLDTALQPTTNRCPINTTRSARCPFIQNPADRSPPTKQQGQKQRRRAPRTTLNSACQPARPSST
jgi:hypothetical protein